jgi:hypothetical protein
VVILMLTEELIEKLAKVLYDNLLNRMGQEAYFATYGVERDTWENAAEFNKDDYRAEAKAAIKFLADEGFLEQD